MTTVEADPSTLQASFWDGAEFPDAEDVLPPDQDSTDDRIGFVNPPANACPTCGEEVVRAPGARGRTPKYHPECKPVAKRTSATGTTRVVKVSKNEELIAQQVEIIVESFRRRIQQLVMLTSLADPYDAFVIHVNAPDFLDNLRGILMQYEWARKYFGLAGTGGSILGFVLSIITTVGPILAHHNILPIKKVAEFLLNLPFIMLKLQEVAASANGDEEVTQTLMGKMKAKMDAQRVREAQMRMEREGPVSASPSAA